MDINHIIKDTYDILFNIIYIYSIKYNNIDFIEIQNILIKVLEY
jgi:hypothetical protein